MIECTIGVDGKGQHLELKGAGGKSEMLQFLGILEELKHRILRDMVGVDDGTEQLFSARDDRGNDLKRRRGDDEDDS